MESRDIFQSFARLLRELLAQGFPFGSELKNYTELTLGTAEFGQVREVLEDEDNCERDPLLDLLLFPDAALKSSLEALLPDTEEQRRLPALLLEEFTADPPESGVLFPDSGQSIRFRLSPDLAQRFLGRLHLDTLIAPRILQAVGEFGADMRFHLRTRLRCVRKPLSDGDVELICGFCQRFPAPEQIFSRHFDLLLNILESIGEGQDPFQGLMSQKRLTHQMIKQVEDFQQKLQREPIEALMMRGERCPSIDIDAAMEQMAQIDRISLALFGRTEEIPEEIDLDHGTFDPDRELESVFSLFQKN